MPACSTLRLKRLIARSTASPSRTETLVKAIPPHEISPIVGDSYSADPFVSTGSRNVATLFFKYYFYGLMEMRHLILPKFLLRTRLTSLVFLCFTAPYMNADRADATESSQTDDRRARLLTDSLINSESFKVRCTAAVALGRLGISDAADSLIRSMQIDSHYAVRCASAKALGNLRHKSAVGPLLRALMDEDALVRKTARSSLRQFHHVEFIDQFKAALDFPNRVIRQAAVEAFSSILAKGETEAGLHVLQASTDADPIISNRAIDALNQIPDAQLHPILIQGLSDSSSDVRRSAAQLLTKQKTADAIGPLADALMRTGEQDHVHQAVREALLRHRGFMNLEKLRQTARVSDSSQERMRAIRIIGAIDDMETIQIIKESISDPDPEIRVAASRAALDARGQNMRSVLDAAIKNEKNARVRQHMTLVYNALK